MKIKKVMTYNDPGHGWAKVKRSELLKLGILNDISQFSYQRGNFVYLEEDSDLSKYIYALKNLGISPEFKETFTNRQSKIRYYERFNV